MSGPWDDLDNDPAAEVRAKGQAHTDDGAKRSVATKLVELAEARYRLAVTTDGEPVALDPDGPNVAHPLRGGRLGLRAALAAGYMEATGKAAAAGSLADALLVIEGRCQAADEFAVYVRVAPWRDGVVVDLGTPDGRAIVVDRAGWRIVARSPVTFRRSDLTMALPDPVRSGRDLMAEPVGNVSAGSWPLVVGWLLAALLPAVPHPIAFMRGEQGTGKTVTATRLVDLIDPQAAPVRGVPRDLEQWVVGAAGSWLVAVDNLTTIPPWLSDALCRAVTGEGLVRRRLYTDGELAVTRLRRCIILTAIDAGALRGDLADRVLTVDLERIDPTRRRGEVDLAAEWEQDRPELLAALLDLLVEVLAVLPSIDLAELPRMADFAKVLAALDKVRPCDGSDGQTLDSYLDTMKNVEADVVADDPVAAAIVTLIERVNPWTGTAGELLARLTAPDPKPRNWPSSARALGGHLRRIAPALRSTGIDVDHHQHRSRREVTLTRRTEKARDQPSQPSQPSQSTAEQGESCDGRATPTVATVARPSHQNPHHDRDCDGSDGSDGPIPTSSDVIDTADDEARWPDLFTGAGS